jgi:hypothetical protein
MLLGLCSKESRGPMQEAASAVTSEREKTASMNGTIIRKCGQKNCSFSVTSELIKSIRMFARSSWKRWLAYRPFSLSHRDLKHIMSNPSATGLRHRGALQNHDPRRPRAASTTVSRRNRNTDAGFGEYLVQLGKILALP